MDIEYERTFLLKQIPDGLKTCKSKEIIDIYIPKAQEHSQIRIRKNGDKYEITKKFPLIGKDSSTSEENTIPLSRNEFELLEKEISGKRLKKIRYYYPCNNLIAEVDVFAEALTGLVLVDFEFASVEEKNNFKMPYFCLAEVTQEAFTAGGILCGKRYADLEKELAKYNYQKLYLK